MGDFDKLFYTIDEAAEILQVHKNTIYNLVRNHKIEHYRVGNQIRITARELERMVVKNSDAPEEDISKSYSVNYGRLPDFLEEQLDAIKEKYSTKYAWKGTKKELFNFLMGIGSVYDISYKMAAFEYRLGMRAEMPDRNDNFLETKHLLDEEQSRKESQN